MPTKGEKLNFYMEIDGEYIPISDMQEITMDEAEEKMIALDFVRVVRCKDCKYYNPETKGCKRNPSVEAWEENDFCSYREREEDAKL